MNNQEDSVLVPMIPGPTKTDGNEDTVRKEERKDAAKI